MILFTKIPTLGEAQSIIIGLYDLLERETDKHDYDPFPNDVFQCMCLAENFLDRLDAIQIQEILDGTAKEAKLK